MQFNNEKDYIMRMIKEMVRVLFSLMLGKQCTQIELQDENKYEVSGKKLGEFKDMIDQGKINEAENLLLESIDYQNKDEVTAAVLFYQYLDQKEDGFLRENDYSREEILEGLKQLAVRAGYREMCEILE